MLQASLAGTLRRAAGAAHARASLALVGVLAAAAWLSLAAWSLSPWQRWLDHGAWGDLAWLVALCRAVPAGERWLPPLAYGAAWLLMIAAMMLPTTLPLLEKFRRMTQGRGDAASLLALVVAGYVGVWFAFGLVAHALDRLLLDATPASPWLVANGWIVGAAVIAGAGAFQFTELKRRCLEKCRTPLSFVMQHWRGGHERRSAFGLGLHHGAFCLGCCWALMLALLALGTASLLWMAAVAAAIFVEKATSIGTRASVPIALALAGAAVWVAW